MAKQYKLTLLRIEQGQYPKAIFQSSKGEWKMDCSADKLAGLQPGTQYQVTAEKNQSGYWYVVSYQAAGAGGSGSSGGGGYSGGGYKYHPLQFVSNVVGSAIEAGLVKEPREVRDWAAAAWEMTAKPPRNVPQQQGGAPGNYGPGGYDDPGSPPAGGYEQPQYEEPAGY